MRERHRDIKRRGPGMMWDAARDRVVEGGNSVLMGHALKQLASDGNGSWRMTASHDQGEVTIKARHAGFADCVDTEDMFRDCFRRLRARRILP